MAARSWSSLLLGVERPRSRAQKHRARVREIQSSSKWRGRAGRSSPWRNPLSKATEPSAEPTTGEIGTTGLKQSAGRIEEEFLPKLRGKAGIEAYKEMRFNDATVGALLFAIEMLMRQVTWRVEPAGESQADLDKAEFLSQCVDDMSTTFTDFIAEVLTFVPFGFALHEPVFKRRLGKSSDPKRDSKFSDGRIGWQKIPGRAQDTIDRWAFDETGELKGAYQQALPNLRDVFLPIERMLLFRASTAKGNPEGVSVLRTAWKAWYFKRRIEEIEGIGIERDLAGLPVMQVPPEILGANPTDEQRATRLALEQIVQNIRRDEQEGILVPLDYDDEGNERYKLSLLSTGGRRQFDTTSIVSRYDKRILMTVLADFIILGQDQVGSFALSSDKTELFAVAIGAWLDSIEKTIERHAIPQLFDLNTFAQTEEEPKLVHGDVETVDLQGLSDYVQKLASAGVLTGIDDVLENHLREVGGLPELPAQAEREGAGDTGGDKTPPRSGDDPPPKPGPEPAAKAGGVDEGAAVTGSRVLNGAQITAILDIVGRVGQNQISKASAIVLLRVGFGIEPATADEIIGDPSQLTQPPDGGAAGFSE